jgi:glycosyltransferase involved in cell wall biosynthesis
MKPEKQLRVMLVSAFPPNPQGEANYAGLYWRELCRQRPDWSFHVVSQTTALLDEESASWSISRVMHEKGFRRHFNWFRVLIEAARFRPHVVHVQSALYPDFGGVFGELLLLALAPLRLLGVSVVVAMHSTWMRSDIAELSRSRGLPGWAARLVERYYVSVVKAYAAICSGFGIVASSESSPSVERFISDYELRSVSVFAEPHPCPTPVISRGDRDRARARLGLDGRFVALVYGFIREDKGFHLALDAMLDPRLVATDVYLVMAGRPQRESDETYLALLKSNVERPELFHRCRLLPRFLTNDEIDEHVLAADVVILPYTRALGASGPGHHAMGFGTSVIASDVGQNAGFGSAAVLFRSGDAGSLANALYRVATDHSFTQGLAQRRTSYANRYTWSAFASSFASFFENLRHDPESAFKFLESDVRNGARGADQ